MSTGSYIPTAVALLIAVGLGFVAAWIYRARLVASLQERLSGYDAFKRRARARVSDLSARLDAERDRRTNVEAALERLQEAHDALQAEHARMVARVSNRAIAASPPAGPGHATAQPTRGRAQEDVGDAVGDADAPAEIELTEDTAWFALDTEPRASEAPAPAVEGATDRVPMVEQPRAPDSDRPGGRSPGAQADAVTDPPTQQRRAAALEDLARFEAQLDAAQRELAAGLGRDFIPLPDDFGYPSAGSRNLADPPRESPAPSAPTGSAVPAAAGAAGHSRTPVPEATRAPIPEATRAPMPEAGQAPIPETLPAPTPAGSAASSPTSATEVDPAADVLKSEIARRDEEIARLRQRLAPLIGLPLAIATREAERDRLARRLEASDEELGGLRERIAQLEERERLLSQQVRENKHSVEAGRAKTVAKRRSPTRAQRSADAVPRATVPARIPKAGFTATSDAGSDPPKGDARRVAVEPIPPAPRRYEVVPSEVDNLKELPGVGPVIERKLNRLGIFQFRQIAHWSAEEVAWFDARLDAFKGRIERDRWIESAQRAHRTKYGSRKGSARAPGSAAPSASATDEDETA